MDGQEISRRGRLVGVVGDMVILRRLARVMRAIEGNIGDERLVSSLLLLDEFGWALLAANNSTESACTLSALGGQRMLGCEVDDGKRVGIAHAAEKNRFAFEEGGEGGGFLVVPFAGHEGAIAGPREHGRPGGDAFEVFGDAEQAAAAHDHGPRRHADGPLHGPHAVGSGEHAAARHQLVEVRRLDVVGAQRRDGVGTLVVREEEEDVLTFLDFSCG